MASDIMTIGNRRWAGIWPAVKGPRAPPYKKKMAKRSEKFVRVLPIDPVPLMIAETVARALDP